VQTGKKPLQIDAEYVVEVKEKDGDMEVLYDSRGPGRPFVAGLVPKFGGCPKR